jgi:hypothetical protein
MNGNAVFAALSVVGFAAVDAMALTVAWSA